MLDAGCHLGDVVECQPHWSSFFVKVLQFEEPLLWHSTRPIVNILSVCMNSIRLVYGHCYNSSLVRGGSEFENRSFIHSEIFRFYIGSSTYFLE